MQGTLNAEPTVLLMGQPVYLSWTNPQPAGGDWIEGYMLGGAEPVAFFNSVIALAYPEGTLIPAPVLEPGRYQFALYSVIDGSLVARSQEVMVYRDASEIPPPGAGMGTILAVGLAVAAGIAWAMSRRG